VIGSSPFDFPIKIDREGGGSSVSSVFGGANVFRPENGEICVAVTDLPEGGEIRLVVYTKHVED